MPGKKRKGISLGTVLMLCITLIVVGASSYVLPKLRGSSDIRLNTANVLDALNIEIPELTISNIPIHQPQKQNPSTAADSSKEPVHTPAPTAQPTVQPTAVPPQSCTLTLGGTISIQKAIRQSVYYKDAKSYDFTEILPLLTTGLQADTTIVSLENLMNPAADLGSINTTSQVVLMLSSVGIDKVLLGFPDAYGQGLPGLSETINALHAGSISVLGAYTDQAEALSSSVFRCGNLRVAVLHYTDALSSTGKKKMKNDGNSWAVPLIDIEQIRQDIQQARASGAQAIIISLNWGTDKKTQPSNAQKTLAQEIADAGADIIVGTGSMTVQPAVWLTTERGKTLCCYSIGSLLHDDRSNACVAGMLLHLKLTAAPDGSLRFDETSYTPTYIWRYKQENAYHYRVVPCNIPAPDGMESDQVKAMTKALTTVQSALQDSPLTMRQP